MFTNHLEGIPKSKEDRYGLPPKKTTLVKVPPPEILPYRARWCQSNFWRHSGAFPAGFLKKRHGQSHSQAPFLAPFCGRAGIIPFAGARIVPEGRIILP